MPRILVMEGNPIARQQEAAALGLRSASQTYIDAIRADFPNLAIDVVHAADRGQAPPGGAAPADYDGLVIGGSGLHAYDDSFAVRNQIELLREFGKTGKPVLGSCWGLQIAAMAGGGAVGLSPKGREVVFARKISLTPAGAAHPFLAGKGAVFDAPCIHYDEVTSLPEGSVCLAWNAHSAVQAATVPVGRSEVWAVQYHPEFDLGHLALLLTLYAPAMVAQGFFADEDALWAYRVKLEALRRNPADKGLAWQLGIDADILDPKRRRAEIANWVRGRLLSAAG